MRSLHKFVAIAAVSTLAACGSPAPVGGGPDVTVTQSVAMPMPGMSDLAPPAQSGLIRPLDVVEVEVFGVPELTREVTVSASGNIDFPLIGSIPAVGRTTEELSFELENRLRSTYVREPDVNSRITERVDQLFTIGGEVERPGRFAIAEPISLMDAVAMGGGLADYADSEEVLVFRNVGEDRYIGVYNLEGIRRGNYADPTVYPSDIVMVGQNESRARLERVLGIISAIGTPLVVLERALNSN